MKKTIVLFLLSFCFALTVSAQDRIVRNNGETIKCKILEVGSTEIKYIPSDNPTGPVYTIEKEKVARIEFGNGKKEKVNNNSGDWRDPELYSGQLRKAVKVNFLSPLYGYTEFTFEKSTKVGSGHEISLGIIGAGKSESLGVTYYGSTGQLATEKKNQFGAFASYGFKFNKLPDFLFGKTKMSHLMQGTYIKPALYLGNYSENVIAYKGSNQYVKERRNITFSALQIELGRQWVYGDKFLLDIYYGFGYGVDNKKNAGTTVYDDNLTAFNYANSRIGQSPSLSFTFGLRVGLLVK